MNEVYYLSDIKVYIHSEGLHRISLN